MRKISFLEKLREKIDFLNQIPDSIYFNLETKELAIPNKKINILRKNLEKQINCHVMTYRRKSLKLDKKAEKYLCCNIKTAKLKKEEIQILNLYEEIAAQYDISFCVYKKPIKIIPVCESKIFQFLHQQK